MSDISVLVLGAGQEVGRSCVVLHVDDSYVMVDCGMHIGYRDARRFPDFKLLPFHDRLTEMLTAVVITHFHLDHCAALPYLTEVCGYHGPVYTTHPTRAIMPIMLQDYHKVMTERQVGHEWYTQQHIATCMQRVIGVDLNADTQVAPGVVIRALYAGHVLGAAQFHINMHGRTILYTGDYNTAADTHLGAAQMVRLRPDLLISESTYSTTLRDSKKSRERDLTSEVLRTVRGGGKVLIPVMAVGRAQELLILMEDAWRRHGLIGRVPLYFAGTMGGRANLLYRAHVNWASQQLRCSSSRHKAFAFEHIQAWEPAMINSKGPAVLFASPGMLNGGTSLEVFKAWAPDARNLVVMPGYQVAGTVGGKLMAGKVTEIKIGNSTINVMCKVRILSFSAHTDAAGILQLVAASSPRAVMLVHGDKAGQSFMAARINRMLGVPCFYPPNGGDWVRVASPPPLVPVGVRLTSALRTAVATLYPQQPASHTVWPRHTQDTNPQQPPSHTVWPRHTQETHLQAAEQPPQQPPSHTQWPHHTQDTDPQLPQQPQPHQPPQPRQPPQQHPHHQQPQQPQLHQPPPSLHWGLELPPPVCAVAVRGLVVGRQNGDHAADLQLMVQGGTEGGEEEEEGLGAVLAGRFLIHLVE